MIESSDLVAMTNITYKPGTEQRYMEISIVKRRRIDASEGDFAKYTYLAHPFSIQNGLRLLDDEGSDKILSLPSLVSDIEPVNKETVNAKPRLQIINPTEFEDD